jgi:hypothetical protein
LDFREAVMHTVEALQEALQAVERLGYQVRQEWLDGSGGGTCEFGGKHWIFLDLSQSAAERLELTLSVLRIHARKRRVQVSPQLRRLCEQTKVA